MSSKKEVNEVRREAEHILAIGQEDGVLFCHDEDVKLKKKQFYRYEYLVPDEYLGDQQKLTELITELKSLCLELRITGPCRRPLTLIPKLLPKQRRKLDQKDALATLVLKDSCSLSGGGGGGGGRDDFAF